MEKFGLLGNSVYICTKNYDMTQLTINIEDKSMVPHLKKILEAMQGISIAKPQRRCKTGIEEAYDDIKAGRVYRAECVDDMFKSILGA